MKTKVFTYDEVMKNKIEYSKTLEAAANKAQPQQTMSDATNDELERWIAATLVNDEASTDEELIEHFQQGDEVPYAQAKFYVDQRNDALRHGLTFKLTSYYEIEA